jgi:hypothetical protein
MRRGPRFGTSTLPEGAPSALLPETMVNRTGPPTGASMTRLMAQATDSDVVSRHSDTTSATIIPRAFAVRGSTRLVPVPPMVTPMRPARRSWPRPEARRWR